MLEVVLGGLASFAMLVAVHLWDVSRLEAWHDAATALMKEWEGLHPVERLRRGRRLLAEYPEPIL